MRDYMSRDQYYIDVDFTSPCHDYVNKDPEDTITSTECRMVGDDDLDIRSGKIKGGYGYVLYFEMVRSGMKPFLKYRLERKQDTLEFEKIKLTNGKVPVMEDAKYAGLYEYKEEQYCFFMKKNEEEYVVNEISSKQTHNYILVHDIMNVKHHFGLVVAKSVIDFFMQNEQFIFLEDENNHLIETPITGYRGDYYNKISIMAGLGVSRSGPYASLGPFYYFGSYERSLRYAAITMNGKPLEINGKKLTVGDSPVYTKGGIVKYALFLGCHKVMLNLKDDKKDTSVESQKLAFERKFIKDTLRIRDTTGTWAEDFNSIIQPELVIYDREQATDRTLDPQFVLKSYEQQLPLEYAYYKTGHITKDLSTGFYNIKDIIML